MSHRLSSETVYATTVTLDGRAVMLMGPSGTGKSDLAIRLVDRGASLVSDDQTIVRKIGGRLIASAPTTIAGKIEVRGIGILDIGHVDNVAVALVVELGSDMLRMPDDGRERSFLGLKVPLVTIDASSPSAAAKVALALAHLGLTQ